MLGFAYTDRAQAPASSNRRGRGDELNSGSKRAQSPLPRPPKPSRWLKIHVPAALKRDEPPPQVPAAS